MEFSLEDANISEIGGAMPTYFYKCSCGHKEEKFLSSWKDYDKQVCPACNKQLEVVSVPVSAIFKGSGFYETDYKKKSAE